jgi:hypothetical protein
VLDAILQLSACASGTVPDKPAGSLGDPSVFQAMSQLPHVPSYPLQVITVFALQKAQLFVEAEPENWDPVFHWDGCKPSFTPNDFTNAEHSRICVAFASLLTRLGK